ncbi:Ankyrin-3 [Symbiodinium microadriaticum]|uniref:Ankyrin-3 n=1 Tax=Symbiodinium microadriaticum TaxID=2951 RepID=A0A1Q9EWJ8_SYMMI|nr:Ankyrin-3 [Symbiodinium microadriaticum]
MTSAGERDCPAVVTPWAFGAKGDGHTDDSNAIRMALDWASQCQSEVLLGRAGPLSPMKPRFYVPPNSLELTLQNVVITLNGFLVGPTIEVWNPRHDPWPKGSCAYAEGSRSLAAMLRIRMVSGTDLVALSDEELADALEEDQTARGLKVHLQSLLGLPRFRQRLLCEGSIMRDDAELYVPLCLQLVLLNYCKPDAPRLAEFKTAVETDNVQIVEFFLQLPVDPNLLIDRGRPGLGLAASNGSVKSAKLFLEAFAEVDRTDTNGATPLDAACSSGHVDVARLLVDSGADKDAAQRGGATPLHSACRSNRIEIVRFLVEVGANTGKAEANHATPLHVAAVLGHVDVAQLLLEANADQDNASATGITALHLACRLGHLEFVRLLLDARASRDTAQRSGTTPLHLACRYGQLAVVRCLVHARANHNKADSNGATPVDAASAAGHTKIVTELLALNVKEEQARRRPSKPETRSRTSPAEYGYGPVMRWLVEVGVDQGNARRTTTNTQKYCKKRHHRINDIILGSDTASCFYAMQADCKSAGPSPEFARSQWSLLLLRNSRNVTIRGRGGIRGSGDSFWRIRNTQPQVRGYCLLKVDQSEDVQISGLRLADSPMYQVVVARSQRVQLEGLRVSLHHMRLGDEGAHNTDGVSIIASQNVLLSDSVIESGDDNVVVKEGSHNVACHGLLLRRGKGVSIGSLGERGAEMHGARIKTWKGAHGLVKNVTFSMFKTARVVTGILIDQTYCPPSQRPEGCAGGPSDAIRIEDVHFRDFTGTFLHQDRKVLCSLCSGVTYEGIRLQPAGTWARR